MNRGSIVYFAGVDWDAVVGTDRRLITEVARHFAVLWVDPPRSWLTPGRGAQRAHGGRPLTM